MGESRAKVFSARLILLGALFSTLFALAAMVSVRGSNGLPVHDLNNGKEFATIQEAINDNETLPGHIVRVDSGTYFEHVTITKSISLVGVDMARTIIDGSSTGTVVRISANNVSVINFTIRNGGQIYTSYSIDSCLQGEYVNHIQIVNNMFSNAVSCIWFDYSSSIEIINNTVEDAGLVGIVGYALYDSVIDHNYVHDYISDGIHLDGGSQNCEVSSNTVENGFIGISLETDAEALQETEYNIIVMNQIANNTGASISAWKCGTNVYRQNNMTDEHNSLFVWGFDLSNFMQDVDESNIANGKTMCYIINCTDLRIDPSSYSDLGDITLVGCMNIVVEDFDLTSNGDGITIAGSSNCTFVNITLSESVQPIIYGGFPLIRGGLTFFKSNNNTIIDCRVWDDSYGVCEYYSDWNTFYHNSFINNSVNVISDFYSPFQNISSGHFSKGFWDNGFEGNYWSDYNGTDLNKDGIGDVPYMIDPNNKDNNPLLEVIPEFPAFLILPIFSAVTLFVVLIYKRRAQIDSSARICVDIRDEKTE